MAATKNDTTETTGRAKGVNVSATISAEAYAKLEDYRWSNRINKLTDLVRKAVEDFAASLPDDKA